MTRRPVRLLVLLVAIVVTAGAAWRMTTNERHRASVRAEAQATDVAAARITDGLAELRAALHAYVAPGQGDEFWPRRAATLLSDTRAGILDVDAPATVAGHPLAAQTIDQLDRLVALETRAREAVEAGQPVLAGDLIFTDARDHIAEIGQQVSAARQTMARVASSRDVGITNEQSLLAGAVLATWIFVAMLLVPVPTSSPVPGRAASVGTAVPGTDLALHAEEAAPDPGAESATIVWTGGEPDASPSSPAPDVVEPASAALALPAALSSLADVCSAMGRVTDVGDLDALLPSSATLLGATGLIVWVAGEGGTSLAPAAACGYDARTLGRIGSIPLTEDNLTVTAFRTGAAARSASGLRPRAVAVPLVSTSGTVGVLAAEVRPDQDMDTVTALATVIAAQMATLFQPPAAPADAVTPAGEMATDDPEPAPREAEA